jgi:hypothetical protein
LPSPVYPMQCVAPFSGLKEENLLLLCRIILTLNFPFLHSPRFVSTDLLFLLAADQHCDCYCPVTQNFIGDTPYLPFTWVKYHAAFPFSSFLLLSTTHTRIFSRFTLRASGFCWHTCVWCRSTQRDAATTGSCPGLLAETKLCRSGYSWLWECGYEYCDVFDFVHVSVSKDMDEDKIESFLWCG